MHHGRRFAGSQRGFTLIELMIVVSAIGVLALIAFPSYMDTVRKSRRADAAAGLMQLQQLQERYRANNPAYASAIASAPTTSPEKHYALTIGPAASSSYTVTATAQAGSPQFSDTRCRSLIVKMSDGNVVYESKDAAGTVDSANANRCWVK